MNDWHLCSTWEFCDSLFRIYMCLILYIIFDLVLISLGICLSMINFFLCTLLCTIDFWEFACQWSILTCVHFCAPYIFENLLVNDQFLLVYTFVHHRFSRICLSVINSYLCTILCTLNFDFVSRILLWPTVSVTNTPSLLGRRKPSKDAGRRPAIQRVNIIYTTYYLYLLIWKNLKGAAATKSGCSWNVF